MIIGWHHHKLHRCEEDNCFVCSGGLALCDACGGAEGSLPTQCPGRTMTQAEQTAVYDGRLDFDRRLGWVPIKSSAEVKRK